MSIGKMPQGTPGDDDMNYGSTQDHLNEALEQARRILRGETPGDLEKDRHDQWIDGTAQEIEDILAEYAEGEDLTQESLAEATRVVAELRERFPDAAESAKK